MTTAISVLAAFGGILAGTLPMTAILACVFTGISLVAGACNPGHRWWQKPDLGTDILFMFVLPLFTGYARVAFLVLGATFIYRIDDTAELLAFLEGGRGPLATLPVWAQVVVYFLLSDVMMYWTHRAFHTLSLWRFHAVHHAPEHLDWTSATRFHPVNIIFHSTMADAVLLLLGISPATLVLIAPFNVALSGFVHANLNWTLGPFRYVLASPVYHRWHHTDVDRGGSKNFAPTFPFLDLLFGTFYMPKGELPDQYGVDDEHFPEDFLGQLIYPFLKKKNAAAAETQQEARPAL